MSRGFLALVLTLALCGCVTELTRLDFTAYPGTAPQTISFRFAGEVPAWFANKLLVRVAATLPAGMTLVEREGDLEYELALGSFREDYTPIYCVFPTFVALFGCPQGTVTRDYSLKVTARGTPFIYTVWQGRVRRPFGLYYVVPTVRRWIMQAILEELPGRVTASLVQAPR